MLIACAAWVAGMAQETYLVQLLTSENGYVKTDHLWAGEGDTVTLTLVPDHFYEMYHLDVESELMGGGMSDDEPWGPAMAPSYIMIPTTEVSENIYIFVMPASKVKVMADFAPIMIGDVDNNGVVNISDVTALINRLLKGDPYHERADIDRDGMVRITDVTALISLVLANQQ